MFIVIFIFIDQGDVEDLEVAPDTVARNQDRQENQEVDLQENLAVDHLENLVADQEAEVDQGVGQCSCRCWDFFTVNIGSSICHKKYYLKLLEIGHGFDKKFVEVCFNECNKWEISRKFGVSPRF